MFIYYEIKYLYVLINQYQIKIYITYIPVNWLLQFDERPCIKAKLIGGDGFRHQFKGSARSTCDGVCAVLIKDKRTPVLGSVPLSIPWIRVSALYRAEFGLRVRSKADTSVTWTVMVTPAVVESMKSQAEIQKTSHI